MRLRRAFIVRLACEVVGHLLLKECVAHEHTRQFQALQPIIPTLTSTMSSLPPDPGQTSTPSSDFKVILDTALGEYKKKTGKELLDHPLATDLKRCDSVDAILALLRGQASAFQQFRDGDQRLMKWIGPLVDVLFTFSATLGAGISLVRLRIEFIATLSTF